MDRRRGLEGYAPEFTRGMLTLALDQMVSTPGVKPNATHFEPQRASVRAGMLGIACESCPQVSALRLRNYKVSAIAPSSAAIAPSSAGGGDLLLAMIGYSAGKVGTKRLV